MFSLFVDISPSYTTYTLTFTSQQGTVLSAKFDDASVALGAALLANLPTTAVSSGVLEGSVGLSVAELEAARKAEIDMQVSQFVLRTRTNLFGNNFNSHIIMWNDLEGSYYDSIEKVLTALLTSHYSITTLNLIISHPLLT